MKTRLLIMILVAGLIAIYQQSTNDQNPIVWARTWGGTGTDTGDAIFVNEEGDVFVIGTVRDPVDLDPGSGVHQTGSSGHSAFISCFDELGIFKWANSWGATSSTDFLDVAIDQSGEILIIGNERSSSGSDDAHLTKLDPSGNVKWVVTWNDGWSNFGSSVTVDREGNIFVAGYIHSGFGDDPMDLDPGAEISEYTTEQTDAYFTKFDPDGNYIWSRVWGGTGDDNAIDIELDDDGNIYVIGGFNATVDFNPDQDIYELTAQGEIAGYITSFSSDGAHRWAKTCVGSKEGVSDIYWQHAKGMGIDEDGSIYVCGILVGETAWTGADILNDPAIEGRPGDEILMKLDSNGNLIWINSWTNFCIENIQIGQSGNVHLVGTFWEVVDFDPGPGYSILEVPLWHSEACICTLNKNGGFLGAQAIGEFKMVGLAVDSGSNTYILGNYFDDRQVIINTQERREEFNSVGYRDTILVKLEPYY